jgi:hypothetical protein
MAQKINPIIFRKNSRGLFFLNNKLSILTGVSFAYSLKSYDQVRFLIESLLSFFGLILTSLLIVETNNSSFFLSLKYHNQLFSKTFENTGSLKLILVQVVLKLVPVKNICVRLLNNNKVFVSKKKKKKLLLILKSIRLLSCDPFNLIKIVQHTFLSSHFLAFVVANELKLIKKKHNRFLSLCAKILATSVGNGAVVSNLKGLKLCVKGKFNGRLRAKTKLLQVGELSLQKTLSIIDFCCIKSVTLDGVFGVKVWFHY